MLKNTLAYAETAILTIAVCVPVRYLAHLDWPWALAIGLIAAVLLRALIHRKIRQHPHEEAPQ